MRKAILFGLLFISFFGTAQRALIPDTVLNWKRTGAMSGVFVGGWSGSIIGLQSVWYKESWEPKFHLFNDSKQWLGMDKIGHAYTGYTLVKDISALYAWGGVPSKPQLMLSSFISLGYMTGVEILDGFADTWGFSWSDMGANALGVGGYVLQEAMWKEQRILFKFSSHLSPYAKFRPNVLGSTVPERLLKDYNGQSYWLSFSPGSFFEISFPQWLAFSFGYSVDGKIHGLLNEYTVVDASLGSHTFYAHPQFLFSLDVDFDKIPTKKPWAKTVFKVLNHVKIPFPTLIYTKGGLQVSPFYF